MPLSATVLSAALKPDLKAAFVEVGAADNAALDTFMSKLADAIASKVVAHITSSAVVTITPAGSATTCPAGAGTITAAVGTVG